MSPENLDEQARRLQERLVRFFRSRGVPEPEAEELAQETWLRVVAKLKSYDAGRSCFTTWVFAIAHNLLIDWLRRQSRLEDRLDNPGGPEPITPPPEILDEDVLDKLHACLNELSEEERDIICLRYFDGTPLKEIAAKMGYTDSALRAKAFRIRNKLHECLRSRGIEEL